MASSDKRATGQGEAHPWTEDVGAFRVTRLNGNWSCAACKQKFADVEPSVTDLILVRRERNYARGALKGFAPSRDTFYHMKLACLRIRHPNFSLTGSATSKYTDNILCDLEQRTEHEMEKFREFKNQAKE